MKPFAIKPVSYLKASILFLGDKSIAHRAIIISALTQGKTKIYNFPANKDCLHTLEVLKKLGIKISRKKLKGIRGGLLVNVQGKGLYGLKKSERPIFVGDSGTTLRLLLGVLAGQNFVTKLISGPSLSQRPMLRVTKPLRSMGAIINSKRETLNSKLEEFPPITIRGGNLKAITYKMPVASAQVKSAILLAGLYAKGETRVIEPIPTRDHTERMLRLFKADIKVFKNTIVIKGNKKLTSPREIYIAGDISSASFFIVMAIILPKAEILIKRVGLNPLRLGVIKVLKRMGAKIQIKELKDKKSEYESMGDILIKSSSLRGVVIRRNEIPSLIDELPILMVAASLAQGKTIFEGVGELRVKETDRVNAMSKNLRKMGVKLKVLKKKDREDVIIEGAKMLHAARVRSFGDHRTAMSMVVAGSTAKGTTIIDDISCINKSFPDFLTLLKPLIG